MEKLDRRIAAYEAREREKHPTEKLLYAVGDGNHSLATAKACWEEEKSRNPEALQGPAPARYALCELNNIHDPVQIFEPIHRVVKGCDAERLIREAEKVFCGESGWEIPWISGEREGILHVPAGTGLPLQTLQGFLDRWLETHAGELDYIHGREALETVGREPGNVGFLLPPIPKEMLFPEILAGGVLPRKTFSMGEAEEKRYYLESRELREERRGMAPAGAGIAPNQPVPLRGHRSNSP